MDPLTKKDLIELFDQQYDRFATEAQELRKSVEDRNDDVFQKIDQVYGELKTMRVKQASHSLQN